MNQDLINQFKLSLSEFPTFLKGLLKRPMDYIDREPDLDLVKVCLYIFLIEAITNIAATVFALRFSGILTSLIFSPVQVLLIVAFISLVIWFVLDKLGYSQLTFLQVFKVFAIAQMLMSIVATPVWIVLGYVRSADLNFIASILIILGTSYLIYRGLIRQLVIPQKRAAVIVGILTFIFLAPQLTSFFSGYSVRRQVRDKQKIHEIQMEQSIEELEKELGGE